MSIILQNKKRMLSEPEAYKLLKNYEIPLPASGFAKSVEEAVSEAKRIGFPVAMKIVSEDVIHKSDIGGVKLNLASEQSVSDAFQEISNIAQDAGLRLDGVIITEMIKGGVETIIGCSEDAEFGSYIIFGLGGVFVELFKDVSVRVLPLCAQDAEEMVKEVKSSMLLLGYRSEKTKHIAGLVDIITKMSRLVLEEQIAEVDLNPVIVRENDVYVVDARIFKR